MIRVLVGHRGVGKSSLLQRLKSYFPEQQALDLDEEIARTANRSVVDIFSNQGEAAFRQIESNTFQDLIKHHSSAWIAVGAGFDLSNIPTGIEKIWVRRSTDSCARIFLDRPRLNSKRSPSEEYLERFSSRQESYARYSDWSYLMPEGIWGLNEIEKSLFVGQFSLNSATITLSSSDLERCQRILSWSPRLLEIRDDIFSEGEIAHLLSSLPKDKLIFSFRKADAISRLSVERLHDICWDWPVEFGENSEAPILSLHDRAKAEPLREVIQRLEKASGPRQHLKLAPVIYNISEVFEGMQWQSEEPERRSFLPRSKEGIWSWARLLLRSRQHLNFIQMNGAGVADQPSLYQWLATPVQPHFGAVLGHPVFHSQSPEFHRQFFARKKMAFHSIDLKPEEWAQALPVLKDLGLRAAAVTAPLKSLIDGNNTLIEHQGSWAVANTDGEGLRALTKNIGESENVFVWGGGGTLPVIRQVLPRARFFSARTGEERSPDRGDESNPDIVIWAAGPEAAAPRGWRPQKIIDLNYREDSRAKEFALSIGAEYVSGLLMFETQALAQQKLWSDL